ncbi:MAG TPA: MBL fold metallo-hydrolase [Lutibacter sp.]|nr:MBL fold metallo-hydrolase [Lutibacter sp.]
MKITFLGTGTSQGIPVIGSTHPVCLSNNPKDKRMRAAILINIDGLNIVIDCGQDFRMQMLNAQVTKLDALLFTHEHADHTAGLDDIRQFSIRNGAIPIYAHKRVLTNLIKRYDYIFDDTIIYKGKPKVVINEVTLASFLIQNIKITPIDMLHGSLQVYGYRINNLAYLTDVSSISDKEKEKLQNLDVLIVDALRIEPHPTHFNLEQALDLVDELKPKRAYFTHISHRLGFHNDVQATFPKNVFLAYDGLKISIV